VFAQYKFCVTSENSIAKDYMTEKMWDGWSSGCVPIYLGAPNIADFAPGKNSYVDIRQFPTVDGLLHRVLQLAGDQSAYEAMLAWKKVPVRQLPPNFLRWLAVSDVAKQQSSQCKLCNYVMEHRLHPVNTTRTHCLRNVTWTGSNSTWTGNVLPLDLAELRLAAVNYSSGTCFRMEGCEQPWRDAGS
jgi:hypothetical protein